MGRKWDDWWKSCVIYGVNFEGLRRNSVGQNELDREKEEREVHREINKFEG